MPFELTLRAPKEPAIADGPIRFKLDIRNTSGRELIVPVPTEGSSQFRYSIYTSDGSKLLGTASAGERMDAENWLGDRPDIPPLTSTLPAGLTVSYEDDLMSLLSASLAPGKYLVEASYSAPDGETGTSAREAFEIELSNPIALAQDIELSRGRIAIAEWHRQADGGTLLRKRETDVPQPLGRFFDLNAFESPDPAPPQCAVSMRAAYGVLDYWRWLAWIEQGNLLAGVAHYQRWVNPTQPIALDLEKPALLPFGYTLGDGGALFVAAGVSGGRPRLRLVRITPGDDAQVVVTDVQSEKLPEGTPAATCLWSENDPPELVFGWRLERNGATILVLGRVEALTGEMKAAPKGVFVTLRPVLELSLPPAANAEEERHAQILLGPDPEGDTHFTHISFEIRNPWKQITKDLPDFGPASEHGFSPERAERWVLPSQPNAETVLAAAKGEIWAADLSPGHKPGWTRIAQGEIEPWTVRLWAFSPTHVLCTWFDRTLGYRWRRIEAAGGVSSGN